MQSLILTFLDKMAANMAWQKTLRRSEGPQPQYNGAIALRRSKRLTSVNEESTEEVFADENIGIKKPTIKPNNGTRRRLSTRGSISEVDNAQIPKTVEPKSPVKVLKTLSFLRPIPQANTPGEDFKVRNIPSPMPLPKGVTSK